MWINVVHGCPFVYIRQYFPLRLSQDRELSNHSAATALVFPLKSISEINPNFRESTGARSGFISKQQQAERRCIDAAFVIGYSASLLLAASWFSYSVSYSTVPAILWSAKKPKNESKPGLFLNRFRERKSAVGNRIPAKQDNYSGIINPVCRPK